MSPCLSGGGQAGEILRALDWSASPLGEPASWPQPLCTVVALMLSSKFPMFVAWGPELVFLYNDAYGEILGAKHPAAAGGRFEEIWHEIWSDIYPIVADAMAGKASFFENLPLTIRRHGQFEEAWFTFSYSPVLDQTGSVGGMFCAVAETTDQVLGERHRAEENRRLRHLFQKAPGIIASLVGPEHTFELANDAYLALLGKTDVIGMTVRQAIPELEGQGFYELLDKVYSSGEAFLGREVPVMLQRSRDDELEERFVNFIYQPTFDHRGKVTGIFVEGSDVTEAVRAQNAVRESEQRLRQLANTIPQLAWMAESDGIVHWYNDRWLEFAGTSHEEMMERGWMSIVHPDDVEALTSQWRHSAETGALYEATGRLRSVSGAYHTFFIRAAALRDEAGAIVRWFGTNTDVTPLHTAQDKLRAADRRKDEFLAMLAHELRNPLAPIATGAELLKHAAGNEALVQKTSRVIARQVDHMSKLVEDLVDVSRVTRGHIALRHENLRITDILREAIEQTRPLVETRRQVFSADLPGADYFVNGDKTRLIQIFANILNNAAKYTPDGGNIALRLGANADRLVVTVEDSGAGITATLLPHIFELFTQGERLPDRAQGGLGLGLSLVKRLVELHGGTVAAESAGRGQGSTFTVSLPRALLAPAADIAEPGAVRASKDHSLLVVDDNVDAAQTLAMLLESEGFKVAVAHTAKEALEAGRRLSPTVLFLDIGLPDMDGHMLAREMRGMAATRNSRLVALTGYGQPEDRQKAKDAGFDEFMVKPASLSGMLSVIAEATEAANR
ncbi:PAS domain-containing protein [Massilia sp. R2A-15]|uniref:PAS domain-containing hybrid sensor histidine kinase/response regulator n=1 Tax=Massilia sp. R2A-15 TaxID=3064278 RepID=UPI00273469D5|nr:PAS domain-containing protein [Massilia sp. R2A-15]WLI89084.1 PAS domain-containing protein [Massilia sp. R2A-15]